MRKTLVFLALAFLLVLLGSWTLSAYPLAAQGPTTGANLDEVVFFEEPDAAKAVSMMSAGDAQLYGLGISDPKVLAQLKESKTLTTDMAYGSTSELTFNPAPYKDTSKLNPFTVPAIREAVNWIIDRNYIAKEIYGGVAIPMWTSFNPIFPDFAKVADVAKAIEITYGYNPQKGKDVINAEMKKLGAELTNGKWTYKGAPVTLIFLIRTEDERRGMGDYISKQLEDAGFTVDRQYKTSAEAAPLWSAGDPADGKWTMYTGGWASTAINRDLGTNFEFYYTTRSTQGSSPLWAAYKPAADFDKLADRLNRGDFKDSAERTQLMDQALPLSLKDSVRIFLVNRISAYPHPSTLSVSVDLAAGPFSGMWPFTIKGAKPGGQVKMAQPSMLTQPWNQVAGSNFLYDNTINRATRNPATLPDPYTGLSWPQLVSKAEVTVQTGSPVFKTLDWVTLNYTDTIQVPKDAWADWDADKQAFITAGERFTQTVTAKSRSTVTFDSNMFKTKWHDGSNLSLGDFVMGFILGFDRAKPTSPIYDESAVTAFNSFMKFFKGARIIQKDPLVIEVYTDQINLDAETMATSAANTFFPLYLQGNAPWHTLALANQAEGAKELAYSQAKSTKLKVEWTSYIAGPSLPILEKYLNQSLTKPFIPYANVMSQYVSADEAAARYKNLSAFYKQYSHLWVGNGPYFLYSVKPTEKVVSIRKFADFADPSDKWARFSEPRLATVAIDGPSRVTIGQTANFTLNINFKKDPYPTNDIDAVKYLVVDATGNVAFSGDAKSVKDGQWTVSLTADQTNKLTAGSNQLQVIVASKVVAIPASESMSFVTLK